MVNVVVIPAYKETLSNLEKASLEQCLNVFGKNYPIRIVCPQKLNISMYEQIFRKYAVPIFCVRFSDDNFLSVSAYSNLLLAREFYEKFIDYEYMLLYQLDCWVFRDELQYWCNCGYDYIGAPWFSGFANADENSEMLLWSGNGGFSLRKIAAFIETLNIKNRRKFKRLKSLMQVFQDVVKEKNALRKFLLLPYRVLKYYFDASNNMVDLFCANEDGVIAQCFPVINKDFKLAPASVAMYFSFELLPRKLMRQTGRLPFGCHAWDKYDPKFWQKYITIN
jgi:hypothetical protein